MKWISQQSSELSLGVRIPPGAQSWECPLVSPYISRIFIKTVDNCVSNVYKGHILKLSVGVIFVKNTLKNKGFIIKDTEI